MERYSSRYFFPPLAFPYGKPLYCHGNNTNGKLNVFDKQATHHIVSYLII